MNPRGVVTLAALMFGVTGTVLGIVALTDESPSSIPNGSQSGVGTTIPLTALVPSVAGMNLSEVSKALGAAGLRVVTRYAPSTAVPKNTVISEQPGANTRVAQGSSVVITVSVGP